MEAVGANENKARSQGRSLLMAPPGCIAIWQLQGWLAAWKRHPHLPKGPTLPLPDPNGFGSLLIVGQAA